MGPVPTSFSLRNIAKHPLLHVVSRHVPPVDYLARGGWDQAIKRSNEDNSISNHLQSHYWWLRRRYLLAEPHSPSRYSIILVFSLTSGAIVVCAFKSTTYTSILRCSAINLTCEFRRLEASFLRCRWLRHMQGDTCYALAISQPAQAQFHKHYSIQRMRYHLSEHAAANLIILLQRTDMLICCNMPACLFGDGLDPGR